MCRLSWAQVLLVSELQGRVTVSRKAAGGDRNWEVDVRSGTEAAAVVPAGRNTETSRSEAGSDRKPA